jgi:hypothetical protein
MRGSPQYRGHRRAAGLFPTTTMGCNKDFCCQRGESASRSHFEIGITTSNFGDEIIPISFEAKRRIELGFPASEVLPLLPELF